MKQNLLGIRERSEFIAPSRGRGLKPSAGSMRNGTLYRPFTGARIETRLLINTYQEETIAPSRGRGLKRDGTCRSVRTCYRPFTGARIETCEIDTDFLP